MELKKLIAGVVFLVIGIIAISYSLSLPCDVGPITQTVEGAAGTQEVTVEQPEQMNKMICLGTDKTALIMMLIGTASIFPAISGVFKGITEEPGKKE